MMNSTLEKYSSQIKTTTISTRSFCPLILYHDKPSNQLSINLNVNKHNNRTAIDRHRDKTNEMLEHNAQFWTEKSDLVMDDEADYLDKDIEVSPSTSTTSNISSSSSSSGESIATIDMHHGGHQHHNIRSPVIETSSSTPVVGHHRHVGLYYNEESAEDSKLSFYQPPLSLKIAHTPTASKSATITTTTIPAAVDSTKKRRRGNLPKEVTEFLRKWLIQHKKHPYPAEKEKADLARHTGLTVNQISNWFINARRRILQPMLESENLTAQMMAYPNFVATTAPSSPGGASTGGNNNLSAFEQPRRRRHDFYTYQRDFASNNIPDHYHHYHSSVSPPPQYMQQQETHQYHYNQPPQYSPIDDDSHHSSRFVFRRTRMIDDHYNNNNQIPMR